MQINMYNYDSKPINQHSPKHQMEVSRKRPGEVLFVAEVPPPSSGTGVRFPYKGAERSSTSSIGELLSGSRFR